VEFYLQDAHAMEPTLVTASGSETTNAPGIRTIASTAAPSVVDVCESAGEQCRPHSIRSGFSGAT
jgi:hypothetical protein